MAKQMCKITQGLVRDRGATWFPELVDKSKVMVSILYSSGVVHCAPIRKKCQDSSVLGDEL